MNKVLFEENAIYSADEAAKILSRHPKTIRRLCQKGIIQARSGKSGYLITGWALRAYAENRCILNT